MKSAIIFACAAVVILGGLVFFIPQQNKETRPSTHSENRRLSNTAPLLPTEPFSPDSVANISTQRASQKKPPTPPIPTPQKIQHLWQEGDYAGAAADFRQWLTTEPAAAFDYIAAMQPPMEPSHFGPALQSYVEGLPRQEAMTLIAKLDGNAKLQESVSADLYAQWSTDQPAAAISWLYEKANDPWREALAYRNARLGHFGEPSTAISQMIQGPPGSVTNHLVSGILEHWLVTDSTAATGYLNAAERSPAFDQAVAKHAEGLLNIDPVTAMSWAASIEDEGLRTMVISQVEQNWTPADQARYQKLHK